MTSVNPSRMANHSQPGGVNPKVSSMSAVRVTAKIGKCQRYMP